MRTQYSHLTDRELIRLVDAQDCSALEHELNNRLIRATVGADFYERTGRAASYTVSAARLKAMVPVEHDVGPEANNV